MTVADIKDENMLKPVMTADGRPWVQRCFRCSKIVDFLKMSHGSEYVKVGHLVRHAKCLPEVVR